MSKRGGGTPGGARLLLASVSAIALSAGGWHGARGADDCGPPFLNAVSCLSPAMGQDFQDADGITYSTADLTITIDSGVTAEHVYNGGFGSYGNLTINNYGTLDQTAVSDGVARAGLFAASDNGTVFIRSGGNIDTYSFAVSGIYGTGSGLASATTDDGTTITTQGDFAHGMFLYSSLGDISAMSGSLITTHGEYAFGITAIADGEIVITTSAASGIATYGRSATGITVTNNDAVTITSNGAITTSGLTATGIYARSYAPGTVLSITSTARIQTAGLNSSGIYALAFRRNDGGSADIEISSTADIAVREGLGDGIHAYAEQGTITVTVASGVTVSTNSVNSYAADAGDAISAYGRDGVTVYSYGALRSYGDFGRGIYANARNAQVAVTTDGSIATTGASAIGIVALGDAGVTITGDASISTQGAGAHGIYARAGASESGGAAITITQGSSIMTAGVGANGIDAATDFDGPLSITTLAAGGITLDQSGATGILGRSLYGQITADIAGDVTATLGVGIDLESAVDGALDIDIAGDVAAAGAGLRAATGGLISFDMAAAGSVQTTTTAAIAVTLSGDQVDVNNAGRIDGGSIGLLLQAGTASSLVNSGFIGGGLDLAIDATAASGLTLIENSGTLRGFITLGGQGTRFENQSGGLFLLQDRGDLDALSDFGGGSDAFINEAGATLRLAALSGGPEAARFLGLESFENHGRITLADLEAGAALAEAGDSVFISGDFVSQGGTLALDVVLGDSSSAADLLHVGGNLTAPGGPTLLEVVNAGGLGAETTGNGILVVQVDGSSAAGAFVLDGGPIAVDSFTYELVQQADGNWYLVSTGDPGPPPPPVPTVTETPVPDYRALASGALELPHGLTDALHQRLGELRYFLRQDAQSAALGADDAAQIAVRPGAGGATTNGLWLRGLGSSITYDGDVGLGFRQDSSGLQAGFDLGFQDAIGHGDTLLLGGFGSLMAASGDVGASDAAFSIDAYGFGLYGTWLRPDGLYLDAVATLSFLDLEQVTPQFDARLDASGMTVSGSLEAGYHVALGRGLFLEPQAQLYYARAFLDDATDSQGNPVTFDDSQSLQGRLGARGGATFGVGANGRLTPYLDVSVLQEFLGESRVVTGTADQRNDLSGRALELGVGLEAAALASNLSLHVDADWIHGEETEGFRVVAGLRLTW